MLKCGLEEGNCSSDSDGEEGSGTTGPPPRNNVFDYVALPPFKDLYNWKDQSKQSPLVQLAFEFGPSCIPLSAVGMILNFTGNHLLNYIYNVYRRRIFFPMHKVLSVSLLSNGEIMTTAQKTECSIICDPSDAARPAYAYTSLSGGGSSGNFTVLVHSSKTVTFRSKAIVLSMGGVQQLHPDFYKWFPALAEKKENVVLSDYFLQREGYLATMKRVVRERIKNVVIVGGSHSGFSAAWMLMNGPSDVLHNTHVKPSCQLRHIPGTKVHFPDAAFKSIADCKTCCACRTDQAKCACVCKCFGFFRY